MGHPSVSIQSFQTASMMCMPATPHHAFCSIYRPYTQQNPARQTLFPHLLRRQRANQFIEQTKRLHHLANDLIGINLLSSKLSFYSVVKVRTINKSYLMAVCGKCTDNTYEAYKINNIMRLSFIITLTIFKIQPVTAIKL